MSRTKKRTKKRGKSVDKSCGNNRGCPVCTSNRTHKIKKQIERADDLEFFPPDDPCNEIHGMLADLCDILFDDPERAMDHGYDGVLERAREVMDCARVRASESMEAMRNARLKKATEDFERDQPCTIGRMILRDGEWFFD